jgi:hypothetical protein
MVRVYALPFRNTVLSKHLLGAFDRICGAIIGPAGRISRI